MEIQGAGGVMPASTAKDFKEIQDARLVTKTVEQMNTRPDGTLNPEFDFQTTMLSGGAALKGGTLNIKA